MNNDMLYYDYVPLIGAKLYLKELTEIFRSSSANIDSLLLEELQVSPSRALFNSNMVDDCGNAIAKLRERESAILTLSTLLMEWLGDKPKGEFTIGTLQYLSARLEGYILPLKKEEGVSLVDVKTEGYCVTLTNGVVLKGVIPEVTVSKTGTKENNYTSMVPSFLLMFTGEMEGELLYAGKNYGGRGVGLLKMCPVTTQGETTNSSLYRPIYLIVNLHGSAMFNDDIYLVIPEDMVDEMIEFNNLKNPGQELEVKA